MNLETEASSGMRLYPNPTYGSVTIELEYTTGRTINVVVYNALNMVVLRRSHNAPDNRVGIDLSGLPQGVYLVELGDGASRSIQRVVKN